jgi:molybdopterin-guanine dinucleotide biosynthesis protein A
MKFDSVILAGGKSRRMGQDKGLMMHHQSVLQSSGMKSTHMSQPMVSWVAASLAGFDNLWVNTNEHKQAYEQLGFVTIKDVLHPDIGPLAGPLLGVLTGLQKATSDWVLFSPCDTPNIPTNYPCVMTRFAQENISDAYVVFDGERRQNLHLLLHRSLIEDLIAYLLSGGRKTYEWLERVSAMNVDFSDQKLAFKNFNSPSDIE